MNSAFSAWNQPRERPHSIIRRPRILVRGINWLGDAVMTTPALLRLREKFPGGAHRPALPGETGANYGCIIRR